MSEEGEQMRNEVTHNDWSFDGALRKIPNAYETSN